MKQFRVIFAIAALLLLPAPVFAMDLDAIQDLVAQGQLDEALQELTPLIRAKPDNPDARFLRGVIYAQKGDTERAISIFHSLTQEFPELSEPYNNLAVLYAAQGNYVKAGEALKKAVKLQPDYDTAHENLGDVYAKLAALSYEQAFEASQQNRRARSKSDVLAKMLNQKVAKGDIVQVVHQPATLPAPPPTVQTKQAQKPEPQDQKPVVEPALSPRCYTVGPIDGEPAMARLATWLRTRGAEVDADVRGGASRVHKVYIPLQPGRTPRQVMDMLRDKGVRDFLPIRSGELRNTISVGVYSHDESVQRRRSQLQKLGFETRVQSSGGDKLQQYWIYLDARHGEKEIAPGPFRKSFPKHRLMSTSCK